METGKKDGVKYDPIKGLADYLAGISVIQTPYIPDDFLEDFNDYYFDEDEEDFVI